MGWFSFLFSSKKKKVKYKVFESLEHAQSVIPLNKAVLVEAGKTKICFARTENNLFAIEDICPHEFKPLHKGNCTLNNEIVCPYHRHLIDLKTGQNKSHAGCGKTNTFDILQSSNGIYVFV